MVQLNICMPDGDEKVIIVCQKKEDLKNITVSELKKKIKDQLKIKEDIRLVFGAEKLNESQTLAHYGIQHLSTIQTLLILHGGI